MTSCGTGCSVPQQDIAGEQRMAEKGMVFNIQKYSMNDGEGLRTIVFLKGCPLRCSWCSNPESQRRSRQVLATATKCIQCGKCLAVCETGGIADPSKCLCCEKCTEACDAAAREVSGREMTVQEVLDEIEKDRAFYERSGGGVTLSGGEVLMQWRFATELAKAIKKRFLNLAIETTGYAPFEEAYSVIQFCDTVLYDLKHMDSKLHKQYTGVPNELILENARKLAGLNKHIIYRIPLIGGVNDDEKNIDIIIDFAKQTKVNEIDILPYHEFGVAKYQKLGLNYSCDAYTPKDEDVEKIRKKIEAEEINVRIGG